MGYAIELFFDEVSTFSIRHLQSVAAGHSESHGETHSLTSRPHISLAVCLDDQPNETELCSRIAAFSRVVRRCPIRFSYIGTFPGNENVVFLGPVRDSALSSLHALCREMISDLPGRWSFHYAERSWIPHCTLAYKDAVSQVGESVARTVSAFRPLVGEVCSVGVDRFPPTSTICEFELLEREGRQVPSWRDLEFGTESQRSAWIALRDSQIMDRLASFNPVLAGTFPLGIDVPGSDLDVLCEASDLSAFEETVRRSFSKYRSLRIRRSTYQGEDAVVATFRRQKVSVEVFCQRIPVQSQMAYVHLSVEWRLLAMGGVSLRSAVHRLKLAGLKTEPAFARVLGLTGDPYSAVAQLDQVSTAELAVIVSKRLPSLDGGSLTPSGST